MKKRFLNLFLALALVVLVLPMAANAASQCKHNRTASSTIKLVEAKTATCIEDGYEEHYQCTVCGKIYEPYKSSGWKEIDKPVIEKTGKHTFSEDQGYRTGDEPTCTETGIRVLGCSTPDCTATTAQTAPVDPNNHTYENGVCTGCGHCENGHKSNMIVTKAEAATCTKDGARNTVYQCKVCKIYFCKNANREYEYNTTGEFPDNVIPATGDHTLSTKLETVSPQTCTEKEVALYKCRYCEYTEEVAIGEPKGHKLWPKEKVEPTCIATGREAGKQCEYCKQFIEGGAEIPKVDHTPSTQMKSYRAATCQREGRAVYECTTEGCDAEIERIFPKLTCNIEELPAKAATCTEKGKTAGKKCTTCKVGNEYTCAYCKENMVAQKTTKALGHDFTEDLGYREGDEPTCTEAGYRVLGCSRCDATTAQDAAALDHDWDISVLKEATCTIDGMEYHQCKREGCGYWKYVKITKLGHKKVDVPAVAPTCTATGLTVGEKCERCDKTFKAQSIVDKLAHAWENVEAKAATCQENGYSAHRACANCDETDGMTVIPANNTGHNYVNNKCTICGEYDPAHEHQGTGTVTTDSTCTTKGVKSFSCSGCDYTWTEDIAKKAHSYGADDRCTVCQKLNSKHEHSYAQTDYREPTCDIGGQVTKQCSVCGDTTQTTINALGHSYSNGKCIRCGTAAACTHTNTTTRVQKEATCGTTGLKVTTCDNCGVQTDTEVIAATGIHNHVNGVCSCGHRDESKVTSTLDNHGVYIVG